MISFPEQDVLLLEAWTPSGCVNTRSSHGQKLHALHRYDVFPVSLPCTRPLKCMEDDTLLITVTQEKMPMTTKKNFMMQRVIWYASIVKPKN